MIKFKEGNRVINVTRDDFGLGTILKITRFKDENYAIWIKWECDERPYGYGLASAKMIEKDLILVVEF